MRCPKCNEKTELDYKYCKSCGVNINEYKEREKLFSDIRYSFFLGVVSTLLILGYPCMQFININVQDISVKDFLASNSKETISCTKKLNDKEISINLEFKDKELQKYEVIYNYSDTTNLEQEKDKLSQYSNETGYIALQEENRLSYIVEPRSIINEEIYDMDGIKLDYQENIDSLKELGYNCK